MKRLFILMAISFFGQTDLSGLPSALPEMEVRLRQMQ